MGCRGSHQQQMLNLLIAFMLLALSPLALGQSKWTVTRVEDGITVKRLDREANPLPAFSSSGTMPGDLFDVLAVLNDVPGRMEWVHACADSKELQKTSDYERVLYHRTDVPWPFADRDAVLQINVTLDRKAKKAIIRYRPNKTVRYAANDEYVHLEKIEGHYTLEQLTNATTRVTYFVDAHPGGWIPNWLARLASEDLPYETLKNLRERVEATKASNRYKSFLARYRE